MVYVLSDALGVSGGYIMAKANFHGGGPFDPPSGQVTVEVPDGVTKTFNGGQALNSLTNSGWAHGGPDGCGYGAFPEEKSSGDVAGPPWRGRNGFRVG